MKLQRPQVVNPGTPNEYVDEYSSGEYWWVAHPDGAGSTEEERYLEQYRYELEIHGGVSDDEASYSYDDFALIEAPNGTFYMLETSGCSCPSPSETWRIEARGTLKDIRDYVLEDAKTGYGVIKNQTGEFIALIDEVSLKKYGKVL